MIGIYFYVLFSLGRCEVTPLHIIGTTDRMDRCDIYCGKPVPEAYYWYKLSIFYSLQATCLD